MKTEPTAPAAGPEAPVNQDVRPEASAYGSQNNAFSSAQLRAGCEAARRLLHYAVMGNVREPLK